MKRYMHKHHDKNGEAGHANVRYLRTGQTKRALILQTKNYKGEKQWRNITQRVI